MANDLLGMIQGYLTPDVMGKIGSLVGESPANAEKGLGSAIPAVLSGLMNMGSTSSGASTLLNLVNGYMSGNLGGSLLSSLPALLGNSQQSSSMLSTGADLLGKIFGNKTPSVAEQVAKAVGIGGPSATSLLSLAAPLVLSVLGKETKSRGLNAAGLASLLLGQKDAIGRLAPAGLSSILGSVAAAATDHGTAARTARVEPARTPVAPKPASPLRWLIPLLALLGLGSLFSSRGCGEAERKPVVVPPPAKPAAQAPAPAAPAPVAQAPVAAAPAAEGLASITLPGGASIQVKPGGFRFNLAKYLANTADTTVPRTFIFDDLNFDSASTNLTPESLETLNQLILIMKAYPTAQFRLDGHTDSTGDAAANKTLSQQRADAVKARMTAGGIDAGRMSTAGWGQEKPIASNDTEEGKARNRRTELVVTAK
jgi:outer membrane protein OmpA-like peptidoglycan-associated protein